MTRPDAQELHDTLFRLRAHYHDPVPSDPLALIDAALAAAEQRGREEEREKLAKRYDDEADRLEQASIDTLSVADKMRLDASASQCRDLAADIRRGET